MNENPSNMSSASAVPSGVPPGCAVAELIGERFFDPPAMPGQLAAVGRYAILRLIGAGGMGCVFLARDADSQAKVAVKVLKPELAVNPAALRHFLRETRFMRKLQHPHIVPVLEVSESENRPYVVMPFFETGSLAARLHRGQPVPVELVLRVGRQMAEALRCAHAKGVVHRDLKPGNILLGPNGQAVLSDFGLARKEFNDSSLELSRTCFGGTAAYVASEVARGEPGDRLSDLYSLGAVLYEMLAGRPPFEGHTALEILDRVKAGPPEPLDQVNPSAPVGLVRVIQAAMSRERRHRYADASDLASDLLRIEDGRAPLGPHGQWRAPSRWRSLAGRRPGRLVAAAVLMALLGTAAWLGARQLRPRLEVIQQFSRPGVPGWSSALLGDWDGDQAPDLVTMVSNRVQVVAADGSLFTALDAPAAATNAVRLCRLQDITGDGLTEAFLGWNRNSVSHVSVLNQMKFELQRFTFQGTDTNHADFGYCATVLAASRWTDLEADGTPELLAIVYTGWSLNPRGVCCFDGASRGLRWFFHTAPCVTDIALADLDGDGRQDVVFGSDAVCNLNRLSDGTDDSHSYVYAVSSRGTLLWRKTVGGPYTRSMPLVLLGGTGAPPRVYAWRLNNPSQAVPERNRASLVAFDSSGNTVAQFNPGAGIQSCLPADLEGDGRAELLATDQRGMLHVLDPNLVLQRSVQVMSTAYHQVTLRLVGCTNLSSRTSCELVLQSSQVEHRQNQGPGSNLRDVNIHFSHDNAVIVLNAGLQPVARHVVAPLWRDPPGWTVHLADWDRDGVQEIVSLSTDVRVLKLRRPRG
ncbi:MAG: serine/threonine protein kinase [Verrucomicrobia bacterium]|nr:serine/threonine protein kinase [Verrucomicrobiota bacterium]